MDLVIGFWTSWKTGFQDPSPLMCSNFLPRPLTKELAVSRVIHRCFYRAVRAKHTQSFTQDRALYAKALGLTAKVNFIYYNIDIL